MDNRLLRRSESEHLPDRWAPPPDAEEDPPCLDPPRSLPT